MKFLRLLLALLLSLSLCACGQKISAMQIAPAELTESETAMAQLLGAGEGQSIFDFHVNDSDVTLQINTYRLVDGTWDLKAGGGGLRFTGSEGRIALSFDKITDSLRIGVQEEMGVSTTEFSMQEQEFKEIGSYATTVLSDAAEILYGQEIPLAIQVLTNQNQIRSFDTSNFFQPWEFEGYGYEGVFAITACFTQEPLA